MASNNQPLNPTELMSAVRSEVTVSGGEPASAVVPESMTLEEIVARIEASTPPDARSPRMPLARPPKEALPAFEFRRLPARDHYTVGEILSFYDVEFIHAAYMATCQRAPDPSGEKDFLQRLRAGALSKVEVLGALRWSEEGRRNNISIDGLRVPYLINRIGRRPVIGPVVRWSQALLGLGRIKDQLRIHDNARATETMHLQHVVADLAARLGGMDVSAKAANEVVSRTHSLEQDHVSRQEYLELERAHQALKVFCESLESRLDDQVQTHVRLTAMEEAIERLGRLSLQGAPESEPAPDDVYVAFEEAFRGSRESVLLKVEPYNAWMRECEAGSVDAPILDVGCGRGEWLELVREHGWIGRGIDLNAGFVEHCRALNLDVVQGDAIALLKRVPDGSVGAITSMHLVEHLPYAVTIALIDECLRVLRPGGSMILETPNPENLIVGAHWFYLDPTHKNPIPPVSLAWLVKQRGFEEARIERLTHGRELDVPMPMDGEDAASRAINFLLQQVSYPADYAIVGRKAAR